MEERGHMFQKQKCFYCNIKSPSLESKIKCVQFAHFAPYFAMLHYPLFASQSWRIDTHKTLDLFLLHQQPPQLILQRIQVQARNP